MQARAFNASEKPFFILALINSPKVYRILCLASLTHGIKVQPQGLCMHGYLFNVRKRVSIF